MTTSTPEPIVVEKPVCGHHPYVSSAHEKLEERTQVLEKSYASLAPMIEMLCKAVHDLTVKIDVMIEDNSTKLEGYGQRIAAGEVKITNVESRTNEVRGWFIGAISALLVAGVGYYLSKIVTVTGQVTTGGGL